MDKQGPGSWYFGWNIVGAATVLTLLTVGLRMGIGPFFLPMTQTLGFSRSELSGIVAVGMLCYGLAMPVAGYLAGTRGTRFVLLTGAAIVVASCVWTVNARGPVEFLLAFGVALSVGLGFTSPVALTPVISRWFTRQRGMALFFLSTGSMAGIALMTPLLTHAIAAVGWRETMLGFAALFALVTVPSALFVMRDQAPAHTDLLPHQIVDRPAGAQARPAARAIHRQGERRAGLGAVLADRARAVRLRLQHEPAGHARHAHADGPRFRRVHQRAGHRPDRPGGDLQHAGAGAAVGPAGTAQHPGGDLLRARPGLFALVMVGTHWELYLAASVGGIVWAGSIALSSAILADVYGCGWWDCCTAWPTWDTRWAA